MDKNYIGKWIHVQSYKHDGQLHRTWDSAMIVDVNDDFIVTASTCNKVIESDGRRWFTREPAVSVFFFNEWYNFIAMFKDDSIMYYCNIATPSIIDKDCIKYIDYDLDLKLLSDKSIMQLDSKEYEFHRKKYAYSDELDMVIKSANEYVKDLMTKAETPFNDEKMKEYYALFLKYKEEQEHSVINEK
jgi:hypothetical protein